MASPIQPSESKKPIEPPERSTSSTSSSKSKVGSEAFQNLEDAHNMTSSEIKAAREFTLLENDDFVVIDKDTDYEVETIPGKKNLNIVEVATGTDKIPDAPSFVGTAINAVYNKAVTLTKRSSASPETLEALKQIDTVLGPSHRLNEEQSTKLKVIFNNNPAMANAYIKLASSATGLREMLLTKNHPDWFFAFKAFAGKEIDDFMNIIVATSSEMQTENEEFRLSDADMSILSKLSTLISTRALDRNQQINIDSMGVGLFGLEIDDADRLLDLGGFQAAFDARVKARLEKDPALKNVITATFNRTAENHFYRPLKEWNAKIENSKDKEEIARLNLEKGFLKRNPGGLMQKIAWENVRYNKSGGLLQATRVASFLNNEGRMVEIRATIDLANFPRELTVAESANFIAYIQRLHTLLDDDQVKIWFLRVKHGERPLDVATDLNIPARTQVELFSFQMPNPAETDLLTKVAIEFTYKMTSGISEGLIKI